ncbi:thioredoxin reductase [Ureaplasma diversum]|uniref:Thioredoxin reductase n=2 Tax=Ureaplasma diversum TaxID=42094 RepID=A0A084F1B2_9BACT|nr:FAD-dependent oxidoreductase [Ureaplasma diversum]AJQ45313.1 thioredoxin reductase [Ureaplasma diversum]KEZ24004.1 Thioredoxin reductase [Ureaplasma diversum NCTC 246]
MDQNKVYDIVIIGAGPAGLTAGIYAKRANLDVAVIEKQYPGGKVATTATVENYPGFEQIDGYQLAYNMYDQLVKLNATFIFDEAIEIKINNNYKEVVLKNQTLIAKTVIIATGTKNKKLNIPNEIEFEQKGISYCAICDGVLFKDQDVSVIGAGNSAVEEAIYLAGICNKVYLISNKPHFVAEEYSIQLMQKTPNIIPLMNKQTLSFFGNDSLEGLEYEDKETKVKEKIYVKGNFTFIGLLPSGIKLPNNLVYDPKTGFINTDEHMSTQIVGIYAAGDIVNKNIRQISTAVNDGTIAALHAKEFITRNSWEPTK